MSTFNIYEDQENRVPLSLHGRCNIDEHCDSSAGVSQVNKDLVQSHNIKFNVQNERTVLRSINVNSNIRVQPRRAAKQGVSYESGAPFHQSQDENAAAKTKSFSSNSSCLVSSSSSSSSSSSFRIHEDSSSSSSNTSSSSSSSSWPLSLKSKATSETAEKAAAASSSSLPATAAASCSSEGRSSILTSRPVLREINVADVVPPSPVKIRLKRDVKPLQDVKGSKPRDVDETPEAMDISALDGGSSCMAVDTPATNLLREDILDRRSCFFDVPEYAQHIYTYLREAEICHRPRNNYMLKQTDITASMRWILVDWLVEVSEEYSLHTETLYLAVSYIDRFLSHMSVKRDKLQLVGTTAMFIASKYEEIYPPDVSQFAYITDNTYKVSQIIRMEHLILKVLSFDMAVPTAHLFVNYFARICKCDEETLHLAMFLSELSMLDSDPFLRYLPSLIAASSVALASFTQGKEAWPEVAVAKTMYSLNDLRECYVNLHRSFCRINEPTEHAIREKYKTTKWHNVSVITPRDKFPW